jgi:hypothetical protein
MTLLRGPRIELDKVDTTAEEAVAACRKIVDDWLESSYEPGMTAEKLYELYVSFGEDPFIVPTDYANAVDKESRSFGAWEYAKERAKLLCVK